MGNDWILAPIDVSTDSKCLEKKDAGNGWWWTDAVIVRATELSSKEWLFEDGIPSDSSVHVGIPGDPAWKEIKVKMTWDFTGYVAGAPALAELWIKNNNGGATSKEWEWEAADGATGNETVTIDLTAAGNVGEIGPCCGQIYGLFDDDGGGGAHTLNMEIVSFTALP